MIYCQISKCSRPADFQIYYHPVCNQHGQFILKLKKQNPQAFINWKTSKQSRSRGLLAETNKIKLRNIHPYFS